MELEITESFNQDLLLLSTTSVDSSQLVGTPCNALVASCTSSIYRILLNTDEWKVVQHAALQWQVASQTFLQSEANGCFQFYFLIHRRIFLGILTFSLDHPCRMRIFFIGFKMTSEWLMAQCPTTIECGRIAMHTLRCWGRAGDDLLWKTSIRAQRFWCVSWRVLLEARSQTPGGTPAVVLKLVQQHGRNTFRTHRRSVHKLLPTTTPNCITTQYT